MEPIVASYPSRFTAGPRLLILLCSNHLVFFLRIISSASPASYIDLGTSRWSNRDWHTIGMLPWSRQVVWCYTVSTQRFSTLSKLTSNGLRGSTTRYVYSNSWETKSRLTSQKSGELFGLINTTYSIGAIIAGWFIAGPTVRSDPFVNL